MKRSWELFADKLSKAGRSLGWVSAIDSEGRTIWIVDAHRYDGRRFIVRADEILSAFVELEAAIRKKSIDVVCRSLAVSRRAKLFGRLPKSST